MSEHNLFIGTYIHNNITVCDLLQLLIRLFVRLAKHNIGHIDWSLYMSQVCECNEVYIHVTVCNLRVCTYIFYLNVQPSWLINWTLVNHLNVPFINQKSGYPTLWYIMPSCITR